MRLGAMRASRQGEEWHHERHALGFHGGCELGVTSHCSRCCCSRGTSGSPGHRASDASDTSRRATPYGRCTRYLPPRSSNTPRENLWTRKVGNRPFKINGWMGRCAGGCWFNMSSRASWKRLRSYSLAYYIDQMYVY